MLLLAQLTDWNILGRLLFPVMAVIFLAWGLLTHRSGWTIPGGIFAGLGLGHSPVGPLSAATASIQPGLFLISSARRLGLAQPALAGHIQSLGLVAIDPQSRHRLDRCSLDGRRPGPDDTEYDQHQSGPESGGYWPLHLFWCGGGK